MRASRTMHDLMATVGYLLFWWGRFEQRLAGRPVPPSLKGVQQLRNSVCHGMVGAHADPSPDVEGYVRCLDRSGASVTHAWSDLEAAILSLELADLALGKADALGVPAAYELED